MSTVADAKAQEKDLSYIIPPVDKKLLKSELNKKNFLRKTNNGGNEIYIVTAHTAPNVMREIGRLRELSFALEGGGTGKAVDIDEFDTLPEPYCFKQLIVWNPEDEAIVGGYRFIHGSNMYRSVNGELMTPTAELFHFTDEFINQYLPYTVELGRSFVQPNYQPSVNLRKGMYSLDNLWDGLGTLAVEVPETHYYFGKVTMYAHMNRRAKDLILFFYQKHFPDPDGLMWPNEPLKIESDFNELHALFSGRNYKEDYQILQREVRALGAYVPPLINAYMNLSATMRSFGTAYNHEFGETDETGILVKMHDIYPDKKSRHIESYVTKNRFFDRIHLFRIDMRRMPWYGRTEISAEEREELRTLKRLKRARVRAAATEAAERRERRLQKRREARQRKKAEKAAAENNNQ
ncbi:MAG: GNAT family N-acetyltransferase [Bacteroidales bacterium]|nr:GNAT family N-acetyltransferase [Bacteroidales bacterium]